MRILKRRYESLLKGTFAHPRLVVGAIAASVVGAAVAASGLPRAFLPPFNEGTLLVSIVYNPGISLAEADRLGTIAEKLVKAVPEVRSVGRRTGRAELDEHAEGVHVTEVDIDLAHSARKREEIYAGIRTALSPLPAAIGLGQPISHRLDHMLSGVRAENRRQDLRRMIWIASARSQKPCRRASPASRASQTCRRRNRF